MIAIVACLLFSTVSSISQAEVAFPKGWNPLLHRSAKATGKPLLKPVDAHPAHPKFQSTGSATSSWAYTLQYQGGSCDADQAIASSAVATNQCFVSSSSTSSQPLSVMITCEGAYVVSRLYNSANCNPTTEAGTETKDLNTCSTVNLGDSDYVDVTNQQTFCVSGSSDYPVPAGSWVILNEYGQTGCQQKQNYFSAVKDNTCYKTQTYDEIIGFATYNAFKWSYPSYTNFYDTTPPSVDVIDCSSNTFATTTTKDTTCRDDSTAGSDPFTVSYNPLGYSEQLTLYSSNGAGLTSAPTAAPSTAPTEAPSFAPTMKSIGNLYFRVNITLSGANDAALVFESQQAIIDASSTIMNIPATQVGYVRARSTAGGIVVTIYIESPVSSLNDVPVLYSQLTSALLSAASSSSFTTTLRASAQTQGATQIASAQVTKVTYSPSKFVKTDGTFTTSSTSTASSSSDSLSGGAIAGIVIAAFVFLLVTAGFAYYYNTQYLKEQQLEEERLKEEELAVVDVSVNIGSLSADSEV